MAKLQAVRDVCPLCADLHRRAVLQLGELFRDAEGRMTEARRTLIVAAEAVRQALEALGKEEA
jgi:hypothetical protein